MQLLPLKEVDPTLLRIWRVLGGLFDRKIIGHRFDPALWWEGEYDDLCKALGPHNYGLCLFTYDQLHARDDPRASDLRSITGLRLRCQCTSCLMAQTYFVLDKHIDMVAQGRGECSLIIQPDDYDDDNTVNFTWRETSMFQDLVNQGMLEKEQAKEDLTDLSEKILHRLELTNVGAEILFLRSEIGRLRSELKAREQQQFHLATGGGTMRDKNGRTWTYAQLGQMSAEQQAEETRFGKRINPATLEALKARV